MNKPNSRLRTIFDSEGKPIYAQCLADVGGGAKSYKYNPKKLTNNWEACKHELIMEFADEYIMGWEEVFNDHSMPTFEGGYTMEETRIQDELG